MGLLEQLHAEHKARWAKWMAPRAAVPVPAAATKPPPTRRTANPQAISELERLIRKAAAIARDPGTHRQHAPDLPNHSMSEILAVAAAVYGTTPHDICSERRHKAVVLPRHVAMYIAATMTPRSTPAIGRAIGGRDHSTVLYAIDKIGALRKTNAQLDGEIQTIMAKLADQASEPGRAGDAS